MLKKDGENLKFIPENIEIIGIPFKKEFYNIYENESTIYYSDYLDKAEIINEDYYLDGIKSSFKKFEFPEVSNVGYITLDDTGYKYPFIVSVNSDYFIIKNGELYLIK